MERSVKDLSGYRFECCKEALEDAKFREYFYNVSQANIPMQKSGYLPF